MFQSRNSLCSDFFHERNYQTHRIAEAVVIPVVLVPASSLNCEITEIVHQITKRGIASEPWFNQPGQGDVELFTLHRVSDVLIRRHLYEFSQECRGMLSRPLRELVYESQLSVCNTPLNGFAAKL